LFTARARRSAVFRSLANDEGSGAPRDAATTPRATGTRRRPLRSGRPRLPALHGGHFWQSSTPPQFRAALLEPFGITPVRPMQRAPRRAVVVPPGRGPRIAREQACEACAREA